MKRALVRAALLPTDARFRQWIGAPHRMLAAQYIRDNCCAGESRRLIADDPGCYEAFIRLETQFMIETNRMAVPR